MGTLKDIKKTLEQNKDKLMEKYNIREIAIFGSYIRNEQNRKSDIDILVEFSQTPSLFEFIGLEDYLTEILGVKVDLVMRDSLKPAIGRQILKEAIYL